MTTSESRPNFDFARDISAGWGIVPIEKGSSFWKQLSEDIQFHIDCFDPRRGGFSQIPGGPAELWATGLALESLWWSEVGLGIDDAVSRFKKAHGENAFEKTVGFLSDRLVESTELRGGREIAVGGYENDHSLLSTATTFEAVQVLFTLEELLGEKGSIDAFERDNPDAFPRILNFVDLRWLQSDDMGGFAQVKDQPIPDIWGTHASLEIVKHLVSHRLKDHPQESAQWVRKIQSRTDQIINLLDNYQDPKGGFGFSPNSHPNVFSTMQAAQIYRLLHLFNPDKEEHIHNIGGGNIRSRMLEFLEALRVPLGAAYYGFAHTGRDRPLDLRFSA